MNKFGLLGEHLAHSFSPQIHSLLGDYEYLLYEKTPDEVAGFLARGDFDGLNVTIPYKKAVIPCCAALSRSAEQIGSVNTLVRRPDGTLYGDNTDYDGFSYLLGALGADVAGKKALVLGSGGASLTIRTVLADLGAGEIVVVSRGGKDNYENIGRHNDAQLIVNTTPVGMFPGNGAAPVGLSVFKACAAVVDIIYNPAKTALLLEAEDLGIPCVNGLPMLVAQAKRAAEIFTGLPIDDGVIDDITDKIARRTKNIVLIGMPGSGKSTTGAALAKLLGREFFDTDELIVKAAGKSIPDVFKDDGEDAFRQLETAALAEAAKKSGAVIATGGGIVKKPENRRLIRQNSTAVFLDRPLDALPADGRPLSLQNGVEALARERLPLYSSWCDVRVPVIGVDGTINMIRELLRL
ncbi:shikimate dehydrogenase [Sporobacter termitidis DSM 10068]|uniref:Shikimate kinase n=1 Tax=Sporobacter termitidis DSM 10068 TaxID=1123282 RepID=A0A1M5X2Q1_9FIRM|nr:shikimate kinase [Sporobacter termitidis]SHH93774.1 shikimate dehydrogenase [Sporobacter termitidis DSM 10068]